MPEKVLSHVWVLERLRQAIAYLTGGEKNNLPGYEVVVVQTLCQQLAEIKLAPRHLQDIITDLQKMLADFTVGKDGLHQELQYRVNKSLTSTINTLGGELAAITIHLQPGDKIFFLNGLHERPAGSLEKPLTVIAIPKQPLIGAAQIEFEGDNWHLRDFLIDDGMASKMRRVDRVRNPGQSGTMVPTAVPITTPYAPPAF